LVKVPVTSSAVPALRTEIVELSVVACHPEIILFLRLLSVRKRSVTEKTGRSGI
jgi:hypothetical protein